MSAKTKAIAAHDGLIGGYLSTIAEGGLKMTVSNAITSASIDEQAMNVADSLQSEMNEIIDDLRLQRGDRASVSLLIAMIRFARKEISEMREGRYA